MPNSERFPSWHKVNNAIPSPVRPFWISGANWLSPSNIYFIDKSLPQTKYVPTQVLETCGAHNLSLALPKGPLTPRQRGASDIILITAFISHPLSGTFMKRKEGLRWSACHPVKTRQMCWLQGSYIITQTTHTNMQTHFSRHAGEMKSLGQCIWRMWPC